MAINPFGDESNSVHAWRERYKQIETQANSLRQTLTEAIMALEQKTDEYNALFEEHESTRATLSENNQELKVFRELTKERSKQIEDLEKKFDANTLAKLQIENEELKNKVEDLIGEISRGGVSQTDTSTTPNHNRLNNVLIPVILNNFDPENERYKNAFHSLVEAAIEDGNVMTKIIAILFKYGGSGPINKIKDLVPEKKNLDDAIDILVEEKLITRIDNELSIFMKASDISSIDNWDNLSLEEIIEQLILVIEKGELELVGDTLTNFRDILTDRGTSATTIFFEIRKLNEGLTKQTITRKEGVEQINAWKSKILN